jgi:hypothetical protein
VFAGIQETDGKEHKNKTKGVFIAENVQKNAFFIKKMTIYV